MRMQYTGLMQQATSEGYSADGRKSAQSLAALIWKTLCGIRPAKKKRIDLEELRR